MDVYVEKKVLEDRLITEQPGFDQIREELFTFEGLSLSCYCDQHITYVGH